MIEYIDIVRTISISFLITLILGPIMIPLLRRLKIGQSVRDDGPQTHLKKTGTPTMGGIIMFMALVITVLTSGEFEYKDMYVLLISTFGFGLIGFIDDYIKVVKRRSLGLRAYQKLIGQVILATMLAIYQSSTSAWEAELIVPFLGDTLDIGILYIPFIIFVVVGTVNSVNLTDGLDGLASGVTLIVMAFFGLVALDRGANSVTIFSAALAGACLGFLIHNAYPAKVFMGDTGSMGLGGAVAAIAILLNIPLVIPIVGGVYFIEAISVIMQVTSFKLTGKRVFLMAPLHHHFEQKGWKETKVVAVFWTATVILCLIGILSLKIRL